MTRWHPLRSSAYILPDEVGRPVKAEKVLNLGDLGEKMGFFLGGEDSGAKGLL